MNQPSAARKPWRIPGHGVPMGMPMDQKFGHDVEHGHQRVEHGHVDTLAPPGAVALTQGGLGADDGEEPGDDVPQPAHGRADRRLALRALELVGAAHGLDDGGQCGPVGVGGFRRPCRHGVAEARDGEVDDRRVRGGHVLVAESEALDGTGAEVLGHDVEARRQLQHEIAPGRLLEVDDDGALREVVAQEGGADGAAVGIGHRGRRAPPEVARAGRLDLDHLGAEAPQQLGGVGERLHLLEGQDADAGQRLAPVRRFRVDDVAQPHGPSRPSIAMALPRMIRYTSSSERSLTSCSATARVSGQVESVWG